MGAVRFLTAGESHGQALGVTLEGVPAGLRLTADQIAVDLGRRQRGYGRGARQAIEKDRATILAGVRHGRTLGSPILLQIQNRDWENWTRVMQVDPLSEEEAHELYVAAEDGNKRATPITRVRPGHADLAGALKYDFNDVRNVLERSSARETTARVAAGAVARVFLAELGIEVWSFTAEVGGVAIDPANCTRSRDEADDSPLRCPDPDAEARMIARIDEARSNGDTIGGIFEVVARGVPIGLGSYVHWDRRLDAALAAAVVSINIVKGVEFGLGFEQTRRFGSQVHDVIAGRGAAGRWIHRSNNAGGLTGGVSNGEPIVVRGAVKPISTLARPLPSADLISGLPVDRAHYERSDISVVPAAGVIGEAMVMLTLMNFALDKFGGDSVGETRENLERYRARISRAPEAPIAGGRTPAGGGTRTDEGGGGGQGEAGGHLAGEAASATPDDPAGVRDPTRQSALTGTDVAGSGGDD
ncbi:MAG TPA: chorismate synthase [Candidatus Saccharimonadales bacterium]|nr:chorismate synthase [Candidatus Saccharimonadales bacterium]